MLAPITIRLPEQMMREIETRLSKRMDGADKSQLIRELIAKGLEK